MSLNKGNEFVFAKGHEGDQNLKIFRLKLSNVGLLWKSTEFRKYEGSALYRERKM